MSQEVNFAPGQIIAHIKIPIKDDGIFQEANMTFTVNIIPNKDIIVLSDDPIVTIVDDDYGKLQLTGCDMYLVINTIIPQVCVLSKSEFFKRYSNSAYIFK